MTIQQAQQDVDDWIKTTGVRYFSELTNMVILTEEVGELARIMISHLRNLIKIGTWPMKWQMCFGC